MVGIARYREQSRQHCAPELNYARYDLLGTLSHDDLLAAGQSEDGVRRILDELDEVGVDRKVLAIESGEMNHKILFSGKVFTHT